MAARQKLIPSGSVFGWYTTQGLPEIRRHPDGAPYYAYYCLCRCGNLRWVQRGNLISGGSKSCGCKHAQNMVKRMTISPGRCSITSIVGYYKKNAERRGLRWGLTDRFARNLLGLPCDYCGITSSMTRSRSGVTVKYNGIDRVDPSVPYTPKNCVSCCKTCNSAKAGMSKLDFLVWVQRVAAKSLPKND